MRIAVIEDERPIREGLVHILNKISPEYQVVGSAENGREGLILLEEQDPDLILLDMIMPLLSGMDTARELRQHDPHVPIIFLTSSPEFALESYEVRTFWYLLKPLDLVQSFGDNRLGCLRTL